MGGMSEFSAWTAGIPWWISFSGFLLGLAVIGTALYSYMIKTSTSVSSRKGEAHPPK
jgi:hypothetical protein